MHTTRIAILVTLMLTAPLSIASTAPGAAENDFLSLLAAYCQRDGLKPLHYSSTLIEKEGAPYAASLVSGGKLPTKILKSSSARPEDETAQSYLITGVYAWTQPIGGTSAEAAKFLYEEVQRSWAGESSGGSCAVLRKQVGKVWLWVLVVSSRGGKALDAGDPVISPVIPAEATLKVPRKLWIKSARSFARDVRVEGFADKPVFSARSLPPGTKINRHDGKIFGRPIRRGVWPVMVNARYRDFYGNQRLLAEKMVVRVR